jgi:hypothetical protein
MGVAWADHKHADRSIRVSRSTSPRVVPGANLAVLPPGRGVGEGASHRPGVALPIFSRRVRLSPYAAYLAALAAICGP